MSGRVEVRVPGGVYEVMIGTGLLAAVGEAVRGISSATRAALITDATVGARFAADVVGSMRAAGFDTIVLTIEPGERSKSWAQAGTLLEEMASARLGRDAVVVALGGGVVGDLAGFVASTYLRGVPVVQVPTTLLAQVDSAIGGKTGVDLGAGKNLAGTFWQPSLVVSDISVLDSLPDAEWRSGLAEVVKSAALAGEEAFADLEADASSLLARDAVAVERQVRMAAALKGRVVSGDEREAADRECLNLGHTLAHALEREIGYGLISHGAAVADGLRFAARLAVALGVAPAAWAARQEALLDTLGMVRDGRRCDPAALADAMRSDKKVRAGAVRFVLSEGPGAWQVRPVPDDPVLSLLDAWCSTTGGDA